MNGKRTMLLRHLPAAAMLAAAMLLSACATNPVTGGTDIVTMSEAQEIELGRQMHPKILQQYGRFEDEALQAYVNDVGQRIARASHRPGLQYTFTVLDSDEVNAFALPGGYVYITRGIMGYLNSEAELTAVLGHEVGHVTARHSVRQQTGATAAGIGATLIGVLTGSGDLAGLANMAGTALVRGYGRDMELEADAIGADYLNRLGYEPAAMVDVVRLLKNQEMLEVQIARQEGRQPRVYHGVFSTHPDNDKRLNEVVAAAGTTAVAGQRRSEGREAYLERIAGLPVGPSRAQGVVRASRFYHADLGITVAFPSGWEVDNLPSKVVAARPEKDAFLQLMAMPVPPGLAPREFLARNLSGVSLSGAEPLEVNGLPGYSVIAREIALPWGNRGPARYAVVYLNNLAYVFLGASRLSAAFAANDPIFMSSIRTFRRLKSNEFRLGEPNRIKIVRATPGMRMEELARVSPIKAYPLERLRLLNDLYPDRQPEAGQLLKIVQ
jgi:predicted Zn-dependent protease